MNARSEVMAGFNEVKRAFENEQDGFKKAYLMGCMNGIIWYDDLLCGVDVKLVTDRMINPEHQDMPTKEEVQPKIVKLVN